MERYAENIVNYFDLENYFKAEDPLNTRQIVPKSDIDEDNEGCDSLEEITDYFFDVYSSFSLSNSSYNMTYNDLEHLIEYLVTRYPKEDQIEEKTKLKKCNRRKVRLALKMCV